MGVDTWGQGGVGMGACSATVSGAMSGRGTVGLEGRHWMAKREVREVIPSRKCCVCDL